ncbi:uncharacterized protein LOC117332598 [Pecten maximus]|uniref:uncharacterized protein LOC117332598 n=1 Tax=Pecten maximus TaxID=6579 RepID=UPI001459171B|nr:uncharacterized protein LOC117332598 [Pecten maximus]
MSLSSRANFVSYLFEISYVVQNTHDRLALCGSIEELGTWQLEGAAHAKEFPPKSGTWFAAVELPSKSEFNWKWVVLDEENYAVRWEERPPRHHRTGVCHGRLQTFWNGGEALSIPHQQKFQHIGIDDTGDEMEEEYSIYLMHSAEMVKMADDDMLATKHDCQSETLSTTSTNTIHPISVNMSAQKAIRQQTTSENPSTEGGSEFIAPSGNHRRKISAWIANIREFINTLIEINYS